MDFRGIATSVGAVASPRRVARPTGGLAAVAQASSAVIGSGFAIINKRDVGALVLTPAIAATYRGPIVSSLAATNSTTAVATGWAGHTCPTLASSS